MNLKSSGKLCTLVLGTVIAGAAGAAEPCPWTDSNSAAACAQWDAMALRLEAAEMRANAAEDGMKSMQQALRTMEQALKDMAAQTTSAPVIIAADKAEQSDTSPQLVTQAEDTLDDGEKKVRALIDGFIDRVSTSLTFEPIKLQISRDYQISKEDQGAYSAQFPEVAIIIDDEGRVDFGPVGITVEPQGEALAKILVRLGDKITASDNGRPMMELLIGGQEISGLWSEKAKAYLEARARLSDMKLTVAGEEGMLSVGVLEGTQSLFINDDQSWSQSQAFSASSINFAAEGNSLALDGLNASFNVEGREYNRLMTMADDIQKVVKDNMDAPEPPKEMFQFIIDMLSLFDRFDAGLNINGLLVGNEQFPIAKIATIGVNYGLDAKDPAGTNFNMAMELSGFDTQMAPLPPGILPRDTRIQMALKNIPPNLAKQIMDIAYEGGSPTDKSEAYFQQQFLGMLMSSNLMFEVVDSFIAATDARVDLNLGATVAPGSAMGGTGELALRIENMQTIIDITGASNDQSVAPVLAMLTAFSNRTQENDKTVDSFNLKFTKDAKLLLNDKDVTAMFMPQ